MRKKVCFSTTDMGHRVYFGFRILRNGSSRWEGPSFLWRIRAWIREFFIQLANLFRRRKGHATVLTNVGRDWIIKKLREVEQTTGHFIAWGTGPGVATRESTTLFNEAPEARVAARISQPAFDEIQWVGTMTAEAPRVITNAGNFTHATEGTLIIHGDFPGVPLATGDKIEFTIGLKLL